MGPSKRHQRLVKPTTQFRARTTRSTKGRLLSDPAQNTQLLTEQLRSLGLYAAPTLGDGNCLFRALSDQLHGTPSHHLQLRRDICDWIESHKQRYEPFCEDERGLDAHLACMREQGTYGGHLELSAFAHLTRRNVKVIQPGLVYVIEWKAGGDPPPDPPETLEPFIDDSLLDDREKRRLRRDKKRAEKEKISDSSDSLHSSSQHSSIGSVYVAYHDWEHFSSIRNLRGPHTGLPSVVETLPEDEPPPIPPPSPKKKLIKLKPKGRPKSRMLSVHPESSELPSPSLAPIDIPLSSPSSSPSPAPSTPIELDIIPPSPIPPHSPYNPPPDSTSTTTSTSTSSSLQPAASLRVHRSPKRTFDESSGSGSGSGSASSASVAKRTRSHNHNPNPEPEPDLDEDDVSTPGLSAPGSSSPDSSVSSGASSPLSTPPPASAPPHPKARPHSKPQSPPPQPPAEKPLTRRQRKALGLPKPRAVLTKQASAGKIVIPGGRCQRGAASSQSGGGGVDEDGDVDVDGDGYGEDGEWRRNGAGRLDVRGFRELKI